MTRPTDPRRDQWATADRRATVAIVRARFRTPTVLLALLLTGCRPATTQDESPRLPPPPMTAARSAAVAPSAAPSQAPPAPGPVALPRSGGEHAVRGEHGMITSVEAHATRAGVEILEAGGNAADAAVAVAYALAVTHPSAGNVGGGGIAVIRPKGERTTAIEFREKAPAALTQERFDRMIAGGAVGPAAVGVPGSVAGLEKLREKFGRLSRAEVLAPAIALARDGHRMGARQALALGWAWPSLRRDPAARAIFGRLGKPFPKGAVLRQPDLAATLERIAEQGAPGFYAGVTAERLVASMKQDGMISAADLRGYTAAIREPLAITYRGVGVRIAPPPSAGGVAVAQMLLLLERHRIWEHHGADAVHLFAEIARRVHPTRRFDVVDPDSLSPAQARAKRTEWLDVDRLDKSLLPIDPARATPSSEVHPLFDAAVRELEHTTHLSVLDADGMAVSLTTTLSAGFGARFVAPGTGVVLNNAVAAFGTAGADVPVPGRRMTTSMSPTLLVSGDDAVAVLGSPGGDTIPNTIVQLVLRIIDDQMTVDAAVEAPRVHHGFVPDEIRYEKDRPVPKKVLTELERRGHRVSTKRIPIGDANVIAVADGVSYGYADSREGGLALGPASAVRTKP